MGYGCYGYVMVMMERDGNEMMIGYGYGHLMG